MSITRARELIAIGDREFSKRGALDRLWQDIAENFCPDLADFTTQVTLGFDLTAHLMTGVPALNLRKLADQLAAMLRPRQKPWMKLAARVKNINDDAVAQQWLEWATERMRQAMYARDANFLRATKLGDRFFAGFGNAVLQPTLNRNRDGLLYRTRHLRDTVWCENSDDRIDAVHRRDKLTAKDIVESFPEKVAQAVRDCLKDEPYREFQIRHMVVPADYESDKVKNRARFPYTSYYVDVENETILEEVPQKRLGYVIPRWSFGMFRQYAVSPATMLALPDARLLQQMSVSLLEATEKATNPPLIATEEAVRGDMQIWAGGVTWVDREYDGRLSALRPIEQDFRGVSHGLQMLADVREVMKQTFYLNELHLPELSAKQMTAFETQARISEYLHNALPLFEPMETDYNGGLCEETFELLLENGAFGSPMDMPEILQGADIHFEFESPLQATAERVKVEAYNEVMAMLANTLAINPDAAMNLDLNKMWRDAVGGTQAPSDWVRDEDVVQQLAAARDKQMQAQKMLAGVSQAGAAAEQLGRGAQEVMGKKAADIMGGRMAEHMMNQAGMPQPASQ